jgi:hypothetical protein
MDGMNSKRNQIFAFAISIILAHVSLTPTALSETSESINAYAAWAGRGQIFQTGPNRASFVGAFNGIIFVEKAKELLNGGNMVCPGIIDINLNDGTQNGNGRCTITNSDGERVFAEWTCNGTFASGCNGDIKFTGGTESFEGISGGGPFMARSTIQHTYLTGIGNVVGNASGGMIIWKNVRYILP